MHIDKLTVADVMERNILYFDPDAEDTCYAVCKRLNIYFLPALSGDRYYTYSAQQKRFIELPIEEDQRIIVRVPLFHASDRLQFTTGNVLFVYDNKRLAGMLSFSDYHRPVVTQAITNDLSDFGVLLRRLLELHEKTDHDVFEWLKGQSQELVSEDRLKSLFNQLHPETSHPHMPPFMRFRTKELLAYVAADEHGPIYEDINSEMKDIFSRYTVFKRLNKFADAAKEAIDYAGSMAQYRWDKFGMLDSDVGEFKREYLNLVNAVTTHSMYQRILQENNKRALEQVSQYGSLSEMGRL
ncbi:hypothetical protein JYG30_06170 [Fibrella sp. USSR17]